jgi:hypothetical protein
MCKGEVWEQCNKKFEQNCIGTMGQLLVVSQWIFQRPFLKTCMYKHNIKISKPPWTSYLRTLPINQRWNFTSPSLSKPILNKLELGILGIFSLPKFTNEPLVFVFYVKVSHMNFRCLLEVVYKFKKLLVIKSTLNCLPSGLKVWPQNTHLGKIIVIGATQVSEHFLKLYFWMFERSQGKHNSLDYHKFFGIFYINCKVYMFKAWHKSKMFLHVQISQTLRIDNPCFFQMSFFSTKCASFLLKIEENFNIDD